MKGRRHNPAEQIALRATNQIYARKDRVQTAGTDPMNERIAPDASRAKLVQVHMAVLQLRQAREFSVTGSANQLKPTNRPGQLQVVGNSPILRTNPTIQRGRL
jgi:hypothetical protein